MLKKNILSAVFCCVIALGSPAVAYAQENQESCTECVNVCNEGGEACQFENACPQTTQCGNVCPQAMSASLTAQGNCANASQTGIVPESELTRKAIQAEKARNAAENDSFGGAITIIAMSIVLLALIVLSIMFLIFGKVSSNLLARKKRKAHGVTSETAEDHHDEVDSGEVIAAIGMALAEHMGQGHDMEDTILTIKRMKKSYSPWNSKIYNLRQTPHVQPASTSVRRPLK